MLASADDREIDVKNLVARLSPGKQIQSWQLEGVDLVRRSDGAQGTALEIQKDGSTLRVLAAFNSESAKFYSLSPAYFPRLLLRPEVEVHADFVPLVERQSDRISRENEEVRLAEAEAERRAIEERVSRERRAREESEARERRAREEREARERKARIDERLILLRSKINRGELLADEDQQFLEVQGHCDWVAEHLEHRYFQRPSARLAKQVRDKWESLTRLDKSLPILEHAVTMPWGKANESLWTMRTATCRRLRMFEEALDSGQRALSLNPKDYFVHNALGAVYRDMGNLDQAENHFELAEKYGSPPRSQFGQPALDPQTAVVQRRAAEQAIRNMGLR